MSPKIKKSTEISKVPSAVESAKQLIARYPALFDDAYPTILAIADAIMQYKQKCDEYNKPVSLSDRMNIIAKEDAINRLGINL